MVFKSLPGGAQAVTVQNLVQLDDVCGWGFDKHEQSCEILAAPCLQGNGHEVLRSHYACRHAFEIYVSRLLHGLAEQTGFGGQELDRPAVHHHCLPIGLVTPCFEKLIERRQREDQGRSLEQNKDVQVVGGDRLQVKGGAHGTPNSPLPDKTGGP